MGKPQSLAPLVLDHLGTPQAMTDAAAAVKWRADYEPFGKATVKTASTIENNLRLPGQYFDRETGLHYNYFRDYDPTSGRYVEADPIGLEGGMNLYGYVLGNPLSYTDPLGLDVNVCFYPGVLGHVGFGLPGESSTWGFYPGLPGLFKPLGPGAVKSDRHHEEKQCKTIEATPDQDDCMKRCRMKRFVRPGTYKLLTRQCTSFVRDCLKECGLPAGSTSTNPIPDNFYDSL